MFYNSVNDRVSCIHCSNTTPITCLPSPMSQKHCPPKLSSHFCGLNSVDQFFNSITFGYSLLSYCLCLYPMYERNHSVPFLRTDFLSLISFSYISVIANWMISSFRTYMVFHCVHHNYLIHSSIVKHLGYFHILTIVQSAVMDIGAQIFFWTNIFVFGC